MRCSFQICVILFNYAIGSDIYDELLQWKNSYGGTEFTSKMFIKSNV